MYLIKSYLSKWVVFACLAIAPLAFSGQLFAAHGGHSGGSGMGMHSGSFHGDGSHFHGGHDFDRGDWGYGFYGAPYFYFGDGGYNYYTPDYYDNPYPYYYNYGPSVEFGFGE